MSVPHDARDRRSVDNALLLFLVVLLPSRLCRGGQARVSELELEKERIRHALHLDGDVYPVLPKAHLGRLPRSDSD